MQLSKHIDLADGSSCTVTFEEAENWLRATWLGYIDPIEAYNGAARFLTAEQRMRCPYLLNDNSGIRGPWFDSIEWLSQVWMPQATRLGLRYVAHIPQHQELGGEATALKRAIIPQGLEIQVFDDVAGAEEWLREMRQRGPDAGRISTLD